MKSLTLLALSAVFALAPAARAQNPDIHTVYIMPMAGGLDQHLANRITKDHVYQVVTDPKAADAFLTERIGAGFEQRMAELFPPAADDKKDGGATGRGGLKSTASKGTMFLVEVKSRRVVWSDFEKPVDVSPVSLDRWAERVTKKLAGLSTK